MCESHTDKGKEWRCFFCDEVFKDRKSAAAHFGTDEYERCDPVCSWQKGLFEYVLKLERENRQLAEDRDPVLEAWQTCLYEHEQALIVAEQKGYDKGVQDMKTQGLCPEPQKHAV